MRIRHTGLIQPRFLLSALCADDCAIAIPTYDASCIPQRLTGGIVRCLISQCNIDWSDDNINDSDFWAGQADAATVVSTGRGKGSGFDNTEVTEDTDACLPPEVTGNTWSCKFIDYNVDLTAGGDIEFWDTIKIHRNAFQVMFCTPDSYTWGFFPVTMSSKLTQPDTCDNKFNREITFSWKGINEPPRFYLPFLTDLFPI